jgi:hypothetical protein
MRKYKRRHQEYCPKCGECLPFLPFWQDEWQDSWRCIPSQETLELTCRLCGYRWYVRPLDAPEGTK